MKTLLTIVALTVALTAGAQDFLAFNTTNKFSEITTQQHVEVATESIMRLKKPVLPLAQFSTTLASAGKTLITGTVVSILLAGVAIILEDEKLATVAGIASGIVFSGTLIITGSKLQIAGNVYGLE